MGAPALVGDLSSQEPVEIPLDALERDDRTFMYRVTLRVGDLRRSIEAAGQQMPLVVRPSPEEEGRYQIISGFRRAKALADLGAETALVVIRRDLGDDQAAARYSVIENSARETYSDLERAMAIQALEEAGHRSGEVAELMGLTQRQKNNIRSLLEFPPSVREALDDPERRFSAAHAIVLRQARRRHRGLHYGSWIERIEAEELSVRGLKAAISREYAERGERRFESVFHGDGTDWGKGEVRFAPVKINVGALDEAERGRLREELERLLALLGG